MYKRESTLFTGWHMRNVASESASLGLADQFAREPKLSDSPRALLLIAVAVFLVARNAPGAV